MVVEDDVDDNEEEADIENALVGERILFSFGFSIVVTISKQRKKKEAEQMTSTILGQIYSNSVFPNSVAVEPYTPFLEIDEFIYPLCGPYEQSWLSGFYAMMRYAPYFIMIVLYVASFWYKQIYLLFFSLAMSLDGFLNEALNNRFARPWRKPGCPPLWGAAVSYQVENAAFFITFVLGYMSLYRPRTKLWHIMLLFLYYALTVSGMHFMHFHHSDAIVNGAIVGTFTALTVQVLLHWLIVPRLCHMLSLRLIVYWGYMDTLSGGERQPLHVMIDENFRREFGEHEHVTLDYDRVRRFIAKQTY